MCSRVQARPLLSCFNSSDSRSAQQCLIIKVRERFLLVFPDCQDQFFAIQTFLFYFSVCALSRKWKFWGKKELTCVCGLRQMPFTCCFSRLHGKTSGIQTKKPPCRCCFLVSDRLIYCLKAGSHVRHSISTRKSTCDPRRRKHKRSCACLVPVSEHVLFLVLIASYVWTSLNLYDAKITIQFKSVWMHYWRAQGNCSVITARTLKQTWCNTDWCPPVRAPC